MFKKTLSAVLAVVMLVAVFAMALPASADTTEAPKFENLYEFEAYATPNAESATGPVSPNENYALAKLISVNAGDKLYMAPAMMDQSYQMTAYKADGTVHTLQVKVAAEGPLTATAMNEIYTNTGILCYTVPEDVASVRVVVSQNFTDFAVITKNQPITRKDYVDYWEAKGVDITPLIGGGTYTLDPSVLVDVGSTGGKFFGRADNKAANATTTDNLVTDSKGRYYCTQGYIEVKAGDVVYFVGEKDQGYQLVLYDANKDATTQVKKAYMVQYDDLGGNYAIYAYRIREGSKYVRYTFATALNTAGLELFTINQPFTEKTLRMYAQAKGVAADTVDGLFGTYNVLVLGSKRLGTTMSTSASTGAHDAFKQLTEASLGIKITVDIIEHSAFAINMLASDALVDDQTEPLSATMKTALEAKDYDIIIVGLTRRCTPGSAGDVDAAEKAALAKIMPSLKAETNEIYLYAEYGDTEPKTHTTEGGVVNYTETGAKEQHTLADATAYLTGLAKTWADEFECETILYGDVHVAWVAAGTPGRTNGRIGYGVACAIYNTIFGKISENCSFVNGFSDPTMATAIRGYSESTVLKVFPKEAVNLTYTPEAPETPDTPENPDTSDAMIALVAFLGMISLAGIVVLGKKVRN